MSDPKRQPQGSRGPLGDPFGLFGGIGTILTTAVMSLYLANASRIDEVADRLFTIPENAVVAMCRRLGITNAGGIADVVQSFRSLGTAFGDVLRAIARSRVRIFGTPSSDPMPSDQLLTNQVTIYGRPYTIVDIGRSVVLKSDDEEEMITIIDAARFDELLSTLQHPSP